MNQKDKMSIVEFPRGPVVSTPCFHFKGHSFIPGWWTKILQAKCEGKKQSTKNSIATKNILLAKSEIETLSVQFSSVGQLCPTLYDSMNCSTPGLPVHHQLLDSTQIHVHWVGDAIQPFHPLSSPSPPALSLSQHQGLFQWVSSLHQLQHQFQLQHQSYQWTPRTDLL